MGKGRLGQERETDRQTDRQTEGERGEEEERRWWWKWWWCLWWNDWFTVAAHSHAFIWSIPDTFFFPFFFFYLRRTDCRSSTNHDSTGSTRHKKSSSRQHSPMDSGHDTVVYWSGRGLECTYIHKLLSAFISSQKKNSVFETATPLLAE